MQQFTWNFDQTFVLTEIYREKFYFLKIKWRMTQKELQKDLEGYSSRYRFERKCTPPPPTTFMHAHPRRLHSQSNSKAFQMLCSKLQMINMLFLQWWSLPGWACMKSVAMECIPYCCLGNNCTSCLQIFLELFPSGYFSDKSSDSLIRYFARGSYEWPVDGVVLLPLVDNGRMVCTWIFRSCEICQ